jgi:hypothetical protein
MHSSHATPLNYSSDVRSKYGTFFDATAHCVAEASHSSSTSTSVEDLEARGLSPDYTVLYDMYVA